MVSLSAPCLVGFKTRRNFFSRGPSGSTASRGSDLDYSEPITSMPFPDFILMLGPLKAPSPSFDETAFAMNETMPLPTKSSSSLASSASLLPRQLNKWLTFVTKTEFRKMSLRRAPSAISFRGAVPHHRPSSTSSSFSLVDVPGKKKSGTLLLLGAVWDAALPSPPCSSCPFPRPRHRQARRC